MLKQSLFGANNYITLATNKCQLIGTLEENTDYYVKDSSNNALVIQVQYAGKQKAKSYLLKSMYQDEYRKVIVSDTTPWYLSADHESTSISTNTIIRYRLDYTMWIVESIEEVEEDMYYIATDDNKATIVINNIVFPVYNETL